LFVGDGNWRMDMLDIKQLEVQYVTDQTGAKTAVLMPIAEFEELMEDIEDLAAVAERREEPTVSHEDLLVELKRDGLI
jgi:PHD/YefM family antitoxin component YafN of YafNO toxin-antitoxin module